MSKEKDISEKHLEEFNEVFADAVNNCLFKKQVIQPDELEPAVVNTQMRLNGKLHEQERDTVKRWKHGIITLALVGLENQTKVDPEMPLRVISYDGADYKSQVNLRNSQRRRKESVTPLYPVLTLVLYFGKGDWTGPRSLKECFKNVPPELEEFIPDYKIHVVEVGKLTAEEMKNFTSDFQFVVDCLRQMREHANEQEWTYIPSDDRIPDHIDEVMKFMTAMTGNRVFWEDAEVLTSEEKEGKTMIQVIDAATRKRFEEKDRSLAEKDRSLAEKDRSLAEKDRSLAEKDRIIDEQAKKIAELERLLAERQAS